MRFSCWLLEVGGEVLLVVGWSLRNKNGRNLRMGALCLGVFAARKFHISKLKSHLSKPPNKIKQITEATKAKIISFASSL